MTDIAFGSSIEEEAGDLLAVPVFSGLTWGPGADSVAEALGGWLESFLEAREFTGKVGQSVRVPGGDLPYGEVLFLGLGDEADVEGIRRAAGSLGKVAHSYATVATTLNLVDVDGAAEAVALGFLLGSYRFEAYRSEPRANRNERLVLLGGDEEAGAAGVARGRSVARGVVLARDLVNEPAAGKPPEVMAEKAAGLHPSIEVEVLDENQAAARGFGGLMAVSAGAARPPRMVLLRYRPEGAAASLAIVGKGIVFDSGGLTLKTMAAMETMKTDMAGAAAVYGAMLSIAELGVSVNVFGVTPLTENMPGGAAQRPGDVMTAYNGKTIEVLNTDAEGRLILADGLALAAESEPDLLVDVATLTGACKVALGPKIAGALGTHDAVASLLAAARFAGEKVWELPLEQEYRSQLDSTVADMKNVGERWGGAIIAALLLEEFTATRPWVHLDMAGPARADKDEHYISQGGTGFGVRTLVALAEQLGSP